MTQMPEDPKPILEPEAGDLMTPDQVDFLFDRLIALLIRPDGTVVRAASKWDQAALDAAARVILIGENQLGRPIRLLTEKDIDSRSRFR